MKTVILAVLHDRHTDDKYLAFLDVEKAKKQCEEWVESWNVGEPTDQYYGDLCWYLTDDYYAFIEAVQVVE